tara:strand:+ start:83 stop:427 length:345 start_codon:yes stop_codon:yes gene_type:complete
MKVPTMDLTGKVTFPQDKPKDWSAREHEALNTPIDYWKEDDDVGDNSGTTDNHDTDSTLEAEQTADFLELHQRGETIALWRDLMAALNRRKIPAHIWTDEIENRLAAYDFLKEV